MRKNQNTNILAIGCLLCALTLASSAFAAGPVIPLATGSDNSAGALTIKNAPIRVRGYRADLDTGVMLLSDRDSIGVGASLDLRLPFMTGWPRTNSDGNTVHWGFLLDPSVKADFGYVVAGGDPELLRVRVEGSGLALLRRHSVSRDTTLGHVISPEYAHMRDLGLTRSVRGSRRARLQAIVDRCTRPDAPKNCERLGDLTDASHQVGKPYSTSEWIFGHIGVLYEDDRTLGIENLAVSMDTLVFSAHKAMSLGGMKVELCAAARPAGWYFSFSDTQMASRQGGKVTFRMAAEACAGIMLGSVGTLRNTFSLEYMRASATATATEAFGEQVTVNGTLKSLRMYNTISIERIGNIALGLFYRLELPDVRAEIGDANKKSLTAHVAGIRSRF